MLYDDNGISIDGPTSLSDSVDQVERFKSAGWTATLIDGHDPAAITAALEAAKNPTSPSLIACRTTIGYGAPHKGGTAKAHGSALGAEEIAAARKFLGWTSPPFEIPADILQQWRAAGERGSPRALPGKSALPRSIPASAPSSSAVSRGELDGKLKAAVTGLKQKLSAGAEGYRHPRVVGIRA